MFDSTLNKISKYNKTCLSCLYNIFIYVFRPDNNVENINMESNEDFILVKTE